jgi:exosome complex component RRP42
MKDSKMIVNKETISNLAAQGKRLDKRSLTDYRGPITVQTGISKNAEGSARVQIGETVVLAGVKMSIEKPYADTASEGGIMINAELLPLSSPNYESGPPGIKAVELARVTDRGIREAKAIDLKKLCLKEGEQAWFIAIDIISINDAGNLFDAASLAAIAALKDTTLRNFDPETGVVDYKAETDNKLPLLKEPLSVTVGKVNGALLVDPTVEEEKSFDARLSVALDQKGIISALQKGGEHPLTIEEVGQIIDIATEKTEYLRGFLDKAVK